MLWIRMIYYFIGLLLFSYSLLRYYHLWNRNRIPNLIYGLMQGILLAAFFICERKAIWIPDGIGKQLLVAVVTVYRCVMLCTPILCFVRGIIRTVGKRNDGNRTVAFFRFFNHPSRSIYVILILSLIVGGIDFYMTKRITFISYTDSVCAGQDPETMKVLLIADIHIGSEFMEQDIARLSAKVEEQQADIIVFTGEIIDHNSSRYLVDRLAEATKSWHSTYGIYYAVSDSTKNSEILQQRFLQAAQITMLNNKIVKLKNQIQLVGVSDRENEMESQWQQLYKAVDPEKPVIAIKHRPTNAGQLLAEGADYVLSEDATKGVSQMLSLKHHSQYICLQLSITPED